MKNAILFSFLIHALVMLILHLLLPRFEIPEVYDSVAVYFQKAGPEPPVIPEIPPVPDAQVVPDEVSPSASPVPEQPVFSSQNGDSVREVVEALTGSGKGENMPAGTDTNVTESVIMDSGILPGTEEPEKVAMDDEYTGNLPENTIESPGKPDELNISWSDGRERTLLAGEDLVLDVSRNAMLLDQVRIYFSVKPDGTVLSITIEPPGSGNVRVDSQLREWVGLLLFESAVDDQTLASGILRINLKARESLVQ